MGEEICTEHGRPVWEGWEELDLPSMEEVAAKAATQQARAAERTGEVALKMLQRCRNFWTQRRSQIPGGVEAGAPGVAGEGALALGRKQLIKEHKAQGGAGAGAGEGAGAEGGRGLGESWRSWSQRPPQNPQTKKWTRWSEHEVCLTSKERIQTQKSEVRPYGLTTRGLATPQKEGPTIN